MVLPSGESAAVAALVERFEGELPPRFHTKLAGADEAGFAALYRLAAPEPITVMGLEKLRMQAQPPRTLLRLLSPTQPLEPVLGLYEDYPGHWFEASQLRTGLYAGAWARGRLVALAGTHAYAPAEGVAAVGNIVTAADFRGHGLCQALVGFLAAELRKAGCRHIGLHVSPENSPAMACYEKLGFRRHSKVTQYLAEQR